MVYIPSRFTKQSIDNGVWMCVYELWQYYASFAVNPPYKFRVEMYVMIKTEQKDRKRDIDRERAK